MRDAVLSKEVEGLFAGELFAGEQVNSSSGSPLCSLIARDRLVQYFSISDFIPIALMRPVYVTFLNATVKVSPTCIEQKNQRFKRIEDRINIYFWFNKLGH